MEAKEAARRRMRAIRDALAGPDRARQSADVCARLVASDAWTKARSVLLYRSFGSEVETDRLFRHAFSEGKRAGAPRVEGDAIVTVVVTERTQFLPGRFRVPEPEGPEAPETAGWDLVIVPGLAFDRRGHRLGYGLGFYDRFLGHGLGRRSVGLSFRETFVGALPAGPGDVPVARVATPAGVHTANH